MYSGGLDTSGNRTGEFSRYTTFSGLEIMLHVAPYIPNTVPSQRRGEGVLTPVLSKRTVSASIASATSEMTLSLSFLRRVAPHSTPPWCCRASTTCSSSWSPSLERRATRIPHTSAPYAEAKLCVMCENIVVCVCSVCVLHVCCVRMSVRVMLHPP